MRAVMQRNASLGLALAFAAIASAGCIRTACAGGGPAPFGEPRFSATLGVGAAWIAAGQSPPPQIGGLARGGVRLGGLPLSFAIEIIELRLGNALEIQMSIDSTGVPLNPSLHVRNYDLHGAAALLEWNHNADGAGAFALAGAGLDRLDYRNVHVSGLGLTGGAGYRWGEVFAAGLEFRWHRPPHGRSTALDVLAIMLTTRFP